MRHLFNFTQFGETEKYVGASSSNFLFEQDYFEKH